LLRNKDYFGGVFIDYKNYYWQNNLVRLSVLETKDSGEIYVASFDSEAMQKLHFYLEEPCSENDVQRMINEKICNKQGDLWLKVENLNGESVGIVALNSVDERNGTFSVGVQIYPKHRGVGYGTAAMEIMLKYAFEERRLNKYNGAVFEGNTASIEMLERLGCECEGERKEQIYAKGKYVSEFLYGLTKTAYDNRKGEK
jgi:RimJ/RimL family protein N-acetyltransferase